MILAVLDPAEAMFWWVALAVGAVVVAVVVVLFTFLSRLLHDIGHGVAALEQVAERLEHGAAPGALKATASVLQDIRDEIRLHDERLSR